MAKVLVNGMTIEYETYGDGEPLLLVMGLGGQLTSWPAGFVELLAQRFRVIAFDNRDSGLSSETDGPMMTPSAYFRSLVSRRAPDSGYLLADMATDAAGLLAALDIDKANLVGASMGGMIAQTMAVDHPGRVRSLTSIMSNTGDSRNGRTATAMMVKLARRPRLTEENAVDELVMMTTMFAGPTWDEEEIRRLAKASIERSFKPDGTARQLAAINASPDRTPALAAITAPTLVIHGLLDQLVLPSGGTATAKAVPGSRLTMFPEMGHDLPRSRWPEMVELITANAARSS
ncbi:MAG: alpha/beta fold hydrolase [Acidimicrobiales bacterium]